MVRYDAARNAMPSSHMPDPAMAVSRAARVQGARDSTEDRPAEPKLTCSIRTHTRARYCTSQSIHALVSSHVARALAQPSTQRALPLMLAHILHQRRLAARFRRRVQ